MSQRVVRTVSTAAIGTGAADRTAADQRHAVDRTVSRRFVVALDPGHGKETPGKRYHFDGDSEPFAEWAYVRGFASLMAATAPAWSRVVFTVAPHDTADLPLAKRADLANEAGADVTVSLHTNAAGMATSGPGSSVSGFEAITSPGKTASDRVATAILNEVRAAGIKVRTDDSDGDPDKEANLAMLRLTRGPAVLLELGFHDNRRDTRDLLENAGKYAGAIWRGLEIGLGVQP